jgi:hypothetical protein
LKRRANVELQALRDTGQEAACCSILSGPLLAVAV